MNDCAKAVAGLFFCFCFTGCGGGGSSAPPISTPTITSVVINCSPSSITTAQTSNCTASVSGTGSYNSAVRWSATGGTVTSAGVFSPSGAGTAIVSATSSQDQSKSGSANITVSTASTITSVEVNCSPSSITIAQTSTCTASVSGTGSYSSTVNWSAVGGAVTSAGVFTPGATELATITATSTQDPSKSGSANVTLKPNPAPTVAAISPNSIGMGDAGFTLSVVGSNFIPSSKVQWNGIEIGPITLTSSELLTVQIPASAVAGPGHNSVAVVNSPPGGGTSNSLTFAVPCPIPAPAPAANQTRARLGAYYFDGWSGPLTNFHFNGLPLGPYQGRQPLSGWQDFSECAVEQQLAWAHNFGIDFFVFDWYFKAQTYDPEENLNSALQLTHRLANRHGMQYAILYVNHPPFNIQPADWPAAVAEWVGYMSDSAYVRVNGKPALFIYDMDAVRQAFGSSAAVSSAFKQLRAAALSTGLPGVYIAGGISAGYDHNTQSGVFPETSAAMADGYDALTIYAYSWFGTVTGEQPFSVLSESGKWIWSQASSKSTLPFVPVAMDGWDPRPWSGENVWFNRSPQDVSSFVNEAIAWTSSNPQLRPEPDPIPPLILIEAWNELGEGSYMIPTDDDGTSYGDSLAATLMGH